MNARGATAGRVLLGLVFAAAGLSGFVLIFHPPSPAPGLAGQFQDVFFRSRWVLFVDAVEFASGLLLLANRYVPLALTMLAAVVSNIIVFHITMAPAGLPVAAIVAGLWALVANRHRSSFAPLFVKLPPDANATPRTTRNTDAATLAGASWRRV